MFLTFSVKTWVLLAMCARRLVLPGGMPQDDAWRDLIGSNRSNLFFFFYKLLF